MMTLIITRHWQVINIIHQSIYTYKVLISGWQMIQFRRGYIQIMSLFSCLAYICPIFYICAFLFIFSIKYFYNQSLLSYGWKVRGSSILDSMHIPLFFFCLFYKSNGLRLACIRLIK